MRDKSNVMEETTTNVQTTLPYSRICACHVPIMEYVRAMYLSLDMCWPCT